MVLDIMMPFYGRFDHLRLAVESVLRQTSDDWRLVVVDDRFPDQEPGRWVEAIDDPRVSYLRNELNLGVSGNFSQCANLMTSEFGVLMGCDDILRPRFVERVLELVTAYPDAAIVQPGVSVIDDEGRPCRPLADRVKAVYRGRVRGATELRGEPLATSLVRGNWAYFPSLVWRVETIQRIGFRLDLGVVQDLAMILEIIEAGGSLVLDEELVFDYRRHAGSVSAEAGPDGSKFREERQVLRDAADRFDALGWSRGARAARHHYSSRLHALADLPAAIRHSTPLARQTIVDHVLGREYPPLA